MNYSKAYSKGFILPAFIIYIVLFLLPCFMGFYYSFTNWNAMSFETKFIGFENYKDIFSSVGKNNFLSFYNTILYAFVTSILKIVFGLALALILNEGIKTRNILRTIFFMPMTISPLIISVVFSQVYDPTTGILNGFLRSSGLGFLQHAWIADVKIAIWSCIAVEIWKASGFAMVIFLAGLQTIPKSVYEASNIDGANKFTVLRKITMPFLMPSISINMILGLISGLKVFDMIYPLTGGGPGVATEVINITVFNEYSKGAYGYATALGVIMFLFITLISFGVLGIFSKSEVEMT